MMPETCQLKDGRVCTLRQAIVEDAEGLCAFFPVVAAESDFLARLAVECDMSVEQEREFIRERLKQSNSTIIVVEFDGRIIACAGVNGQKFKKFAHYGELGMCVLREFWRLGIGGRIVDYLLGWAQEQGLRKLTLRVFEHNAPAVALYRKAGFIEEGLLKGDVRRADGTYGDTIIMAKHFV